MNKKLNKVRENIEKTEGKIAELKAYLRTLKKKEQMILDEEIIKKFRLLTKNEDAESVLKRLSDETSKSNQNMEEKDEKQNSN